MRKRFSNPADSIKYHTKRSPSGCLEWQSTKNDKGYGYLCFSGDRLAHRVAWRLAKGSIPKGLHILHTCDNPACVEVSHLFLGDPKSNSDDKYAKGRGNTGERGGGAKLQEDDVRAIRLLADGLATQTQIGKFFGISSGQTSRIVNRVNWKHI